MSGFKSDHNLVRDYITAMDHLQYTTLPDGVVAILMTHSNIPANHVDIRLDLHNTIGQVKEKFRTHIGTHVDHQRLILKSNGTTICEMSDDNKMLGFYSVVSGNEIHIIDTDPFSLSRGGGLTDVSLIEKYKMSEEVYEKRAGTMREFIREQRKKDPNFKLTPKMGPGMGKADSGDVTVTTQLPPGVESVAGMEVGMRCELTPGARRGTVRFVGEIPEIKAGGYWVGVQLDEPSGSNDGSVKGARKFECPEKFGAFVRGANVAVGDYPERDLFGSDDEDDNETGKTENDKGKGCCGQEAEEEEDQDEF